MPYRAPSSAQRLLGMIGLYSFASAIALAVLALIALGRVRIRGYGRAWHAVAAGNCIIAANHPSALETFVLPVLFWPLSLVQPAAYPWSVARADAFPRSARWLLGPFRCIMVLPEQPRARANRAAMRAMEALLAERGVLVVYPEGSRTCAGLGHARAGDRVIASLRSDIVASLAAACGSSIMPAGIEFGAIAEKLSVRACLRRVLFEEPLTIAFGEPFRCSGPDAGGADRASLRARMLAA